MKSVGIIGPARSGKTNLFEILMQGEGTHGRGEQVGVVRVPDPRVDRLSAMYEPRKTTYAQLRFVDSAPAVLGTPRKTDPFAGVRNCEALLVVVRAFAEPSAAPSDPRADCREMESELVLNDLAIVEGRRERLAKELRIGKKEGEREHGLLLRCQQVLEAGRPLREEAFQPEEAKMIKGFQLLSRKPCLWLWNRGEAAIGELPAPGPGSLHTQLAVLMEREVVALAPADRPAFRSELGLVEDGLGLIIRKCYELLGLVSFFTVGPDEVKAWTLERGETAVEAAAEIHTDLARGFIRAEVIHCDKLFAAGSHAKAREKGWLRVEGKDYRVADGDVIEIRFSR